MSFSHSLKYRHNDTTSLERFIRDDYKTFAVTRDLFNEDIFVNPVVSPAIAPQDTLIRGSAAFIGLHDPTSERSELYNRIKSYFNNAAGGTIILKNVHLLSFEKQSVLLHILETEHPDVQYLYIVNSKDSDWRAYHTDITHIVTPQLV